MSALNTQISIRDSYPRYSISMFSFGGQPQQQQTGGLFGQAQTNPSPFGVAPPIPGSQTTPTSGGGLFGAASTPASSSLFGAPQPAQVDQRRQEARGRGVGDGRRVRDHQHRPARGAAHRVGE